MGQPAYPGRAAQARHPGGRHHDPVDPEALRSPGRLRGEADRRGASSCGAQAEGIWAADFSTVATATLRTLSVLFFIELGSRRLHLTGVNRKPRLRLRDSAGSQSGGRGAAGDGALPLGAPRPDHALRGRERDQAAGPGSRANATAERWVRTVRNDCLEHFLGLQPQAAGACPARARGWPMRCSSVLRRDVLGGRDPRVLRCRCVRVES